MAFKVNRTFGLEVVMGGCGCKVSRSFLGSELKEPVGEMVYTPCVKHKQAKAQAETVELILGEMLETEVEKVGKEPVAPPVREGLGHSVEMVSAAAGGGTQQKIPIKRIGGGAPARTAVRRAGGTGASSPGVSRAVLESRAAGGGASIDAELARTPDSRTPMQLLPRGGDSRRAVAEAYEEAGEYGEGVTPLDVILGANDPTDGSR